MMYRRFLGQGPVRTTPTWETCLRGEAVLSLRPSRPSRRSSRRSCGVVWRSCGALLASGSPSALAVVVWPSSGSVAVLWCRVAVVWRSCGGCAAVVKRSCGGRAAVVWRSRGGRVAVVWRSCGGRVAVVWRSCGGLVASFGGPVAVLWRPLTVRGADVTAQRICYSITLCLRGIDFNIGVALVSFCNKSAKAPR